MSSPPKTWVLAGPASALARLEPLIEAHRRRRPVRLLASLEAIGGALHNAAAVLLVGGGKSPGRALSGVFLTAPNGARVVAGWLPDAGARLAANAEAAAKALERDGRGPAVVLGEYDERALALADRVTAALSGAAPTFNWTAQRLTPAGLSDALGCGPGIALYVGHALAGGGPAMAASAAARWRVRRPAIRSARFCRSPVRPRHVRGAD
jgi:hypothetical protein